MLKPLDRDFLIVLHEVSRMLRTRADQMARVHGVTRAQWIILARLEREPGISQSAMASIVEVEPITVGRLVDRLEARGLVERRADAHDRRIKRLHLTAQAAPILRDLGTVRDQLHDLVTAGIGARELKTMTDMLLQMKANLIAEARDAQDAS